MPDNSTRIPPGVALNLMNNAGFLADAAHQVIYDSSEKHDRVLLESMRVMRRRLDRAFCEIGAAPC